MKRSLLVEGAGGPLAVVLAGANVPDAQLLAATLAAAIVERPEPEPDYPQHLCLDKGYDNPSGETAALEAGYVTHIRRIGEEKLDTRKKRKHPARRWVVERAGAWLNGCRAILVRWNKKSSNYLGIITLAISLLWYRRAVQLGPLTIQAAVLR